MLMFTVELQLGPDWSNVESGLLQPGHGFTEPRHFSWLYGAYLVMMVVCSMPALFLLRESTQVRRSSQTRPAFRAQRIRAKLFGAVAIDKNWNILELWNFAQINNNYIIIIYVTQYNLA